MTARLLPALLLVSPLAILVACAPSDPEITAARSAAAIAAAPEAKVTGPGQNCISQARVRQSVVRSDQVIDFEMRGGTVYRSILPNRCIGLTLDRAITYENSIDQLCTQQIVYSLRNFGGFLQRGAGCALGEFVPVEYVKKAKE
ncbi:MAG: hypothetical protein ACKO1N_12510 [Erythrobacter sp.]